MTIHDTELEKQISDFEKQIEKNKSKRNIKMISFISLAIFLAFVFFSTQETIFDYIGDFVVSVILGSIYFFFNIALFLPFFRANEQENNHLQYLKSKREQ